MNVNFENVKYTLNILKIYCKLHRIPKKLKNLMR